VEDPELEMVEISRGSIFCACVKGDFIKALYRIAFVIQPEVLVVEASGVANPTDIGRDLFNPVYKGVYKSLDKVCLIDAANFMEQYEVFTALEKQIEASDKFIINKMDLVDTETPEKIKQVILSHNPRATFTETSFAQVDLRDLFSGLSKGETATAKAETTGEAPLLTEDELEKVVDQILDDEAAQVTPPDRLISFACRWLSGNLEDFRKVAESIPPDVVRAKGFIFEADQPYLYSHVGKDFEIAPFTGPRLSNTAVNRVVFIRREFKEDDIRSIFAEHGINLV
jgi:G3E family GTPase